MCYSINKNHIFTSTACVSKTISNIKANFLFANHLDPRLTSVQFPYDYLATRILKRAMELAANELDFKSFDRVPLEIILRQSCGGRKHHSPEELQQLISSLHAKCRLE